MHWTETYNWQTTTLSHGCLKGQVETFVVGTTIREKEWDAHRKQMHTGNLFEHPVDLHFVAQKMAILPKLM